MCDLWMHSKWLLQYLTNDNFGLTSNAMSRDYKPLSANEAHVEHIIGLLQGNDMLLVHLA